MAASLGEGSAKPFKYKSRGTFVNLGQYKAVAMIGRRTLRGPLAWWLARSYHMSQIPGMRRKIRAIVDWTVSLPFARDVAEVGSIGHPRRLEGDFVRAKLEQDTPLGTERSSPSTGDE